MEALLSMKVAAEGVAVAVGDWPLQELLLDALPEDVSPS
jgi:hypothetical protein